MPQFNTAQWNGTGPTGSLSATAIIYDAYRRLGVLRAGQSTSPEAMDDALSSLNDLVDSWNTERLTIYAITRNLYDLTAGEQTYTLGDLEVDGGKRPQRLEAVRIVYSGSTVETPLEILTLEQWGGGRRGVYFDTAFPVGQLHLSPAPASGDRLALYYWSLFGAFQDLETTYDFPPGYALALKTNLALLLAPMARIHTKVDQPLYELIERQAAESLAKIKALNIQPILIGVDPALIGRGYFNISTGKYI